MAVVKEVKPSSYFKADKKLVRWIDPGHLIKKCSRVSPASFEREMRKGKKEQFLSVNCQDIENLTDIVKSYYNRTDDEWVYYVRHTIKNVNSICNKAKGGLLIYDKSNKHFSYNGLAAYSHSPNETSYSHSGIMFYEALLELEEKTLAKLLTDKVSPSKMKKAQTKKSR